MEIYKITGNSIIINILKRCDKESHILFIKNTDILLGLELNESIGGIIMNSYIDDKQLKSPPLIKYQIDTLTTLKINYNKLHNIFKIILINNNNEEITNKYIVKEFDYDQIVCYNLLLNINTNTNNNNTDNNIAINKFAKDCIELDTFDTIKELLTKNKINSYNFTKNLLEKSDIYNGERIKNENNIRENISNMINQQVLKTEELNNVSNISSNKLNEITLVNKINKYSIVLFENNKIKNGGQWYFSNNRFILSIKGNITQLTPENDYLIDINKERWYSSVSILDTLNFLKNSENSNKLIVLIITCYKRIKLLNQVRNTWMKDLKKLGILCMFVIGDCKKNNLQGDILFVNCKDNYESLPQKVFLGFKFCLDNFNFTHVYKVDDDTLINPLNLIFTSLSLTNKDYIGRPEKITKDFNRFWHKGKCQDTKTNSIPYPANRINLNRVYAKGEVGYFLSYKGITNLVKYTNYVFTDLYEDKSIGDVMHSSNISLTELPKNYSKLFDNNCNNIFLDQYTVIVDARDNIERLYNNNIRLNIL